MHSHLARPPLASNSLVLDQAPHLVASMLTTWLSGRINHWRYTIKKELKRTIFILPSNNPKAKFQPYALKTLHTALINKRKLTVSLKIYDNFDLILNNISAAEIHFHLSQQYSLNFPGLKIKTTLCFAVTSLKPKIRELIFNNHEQILN